jgi:putative ABC transport system permease protein
MALGARSRDILVSLTGRGLTLTLAGLAIGAAMALIAARAMRTLFYDFQPDYLAAIALASLVLLVVAGTASLVPARRASRINPMTALQRE